MAHADSQSASRRRSSTHRPAHARHNSTVPSAMMATVAAVVSWASARRWWFTGNRSANPRSALPSCQALHCQMALGAAKLSTRSPDLLTVLPCSGSPGHCPHRGGVDLNDLRICARNVRELDNTENPESKDDYRGWLGSPAFPAAPPALVLCGSISLAAAGDVPLR